MAVDMAMTDKEKKEEAPFGRTGYDMGRRVDQETVPKHLPDGKALSAFLENRFPVSEEEGEKLLAYMEGNGYILGCRQGELYRRGIGQEDGKTPWEPYTIDDAVNDASEWNYRMLLEAEGAVSDAENFDEFTEKSGRLDALREVEKILDGMLDRSGYGKELDALALELAEELFRDMNGKDGLDTAVKKLAEQIKAGEDTLPDVSPALKKQDMGRMR